MGALMVIGSITVAVVGILGLGKKEIYSVIKDFIKSDEGSVALEDAIGVYLRKDESELQKMKTAFNTEVDNRFSNLESLILSSQAAQHDELEKFRQESFASLVQLNNKVIDMLQKQLDK